MRELGVGRFGGDIVVIVDLGGKSQGDQPDFQPLNRDDRAFKLTSPKNTGARVSASPVIDAHFSKVGNGAAPLSVCQV